MSNSQHEKYGLVELIRGVYFDKKMKQNLTLKQNYVEASGDEFQKKVVAMVLYSYEGGKNRSEMAGTFVEYAEDNLELLKRTDPIEVDPNEGAIETTGEVVDGWPARDDVPVIISPEGQ